VRKVKAHSQKMNTASYDAAGAVSPNDIAQVIRDLASLHEQVIDYLKKTHAELLPHRPGSRS
jgi:hypothetical protein